MKAVVYPERQGLEGEVEVVEGGGVGVDFLQQVKFLAQEKEQKFRSPLSQVGCRREEGGVERCE